MDGNRIYLVSEVVDYEGINNVYICKNLKEGNVLFHLYPYSYKREIALDILSKRIAYLYKIKKKRDSIPGELIDVDKNVGNISMTKKEIDNIIERMSKD